MRAVSRMWAMVGALAAGAMLSGCGTSLDFTQFDVNASGEATVPGDPLGGIFNAFPGFANFASFDISQTQEFKNQGVDIEHLESVKLKKLLLKVKAPANGNFDFLDKIAFFAATEGKPKVQIAHKDSIPKGTKEFLLDLDGAELKDYVAAKSMKITTTAEGRSPAQDTTIQVDVTFAVDAKL